MNQLFFFRYSPEVPKTSVGSLVGANLAYVNPPQLDPVSDTGNISIVDRSFSFPENNVLFANTTRTFSGNIGFNDTNNILLTNVYTNTNNLATLAPINQTVPVRPLWYQHIFVPSDPIVASPNGSFSVTIFDNKNNQISSDHYQLFPATGTPTGIYTDLLNTLDTYYFVQYLSPNGQVYKLLSVEPVFVAVDSFTGTGAGQYIATQTTTNWQIQVTGDPTVTYSILTIGTTKINVQHPIQAASTAAWYVRISNGYFKRVLPASAGGSNTYEYYIPEYVAQPWNPKSPFQYQIDEQPIFLDNNLLRLRQNPISPLGEIANDVEIYIRNSTQRSDATNQYINGTGQNFDPVPYSGNTISNVWWRVLVDDIDRNTGLVKTGGLSSPPVAGPWGVANTQITTGNDSLMYINDDLHAFYFFEQLDYVYTKISLNPIFDTTLLSTGVSIYIKPARANVGGVVYAPTTVVDHIIFDQNENIIGASDPLVPLNGTVDDFFAASDSSGIPIIGKDQTKFLELARIFVRNTAVITDITDSNLVDTRIPGGVLLPNLPAEIVAQINLDTHGLYPLLNWQGEVLPGNSVVIIKVPSYLLNDNFMVSGNPLTGSALTQRMIDIRTTCKKHLAAGVLPIVRFYDNNTGLVLPIKPPLDRTLF